MVQLARHNHHRGYKKQSRLFISRKLLIFEEMKDVGCNVTVFETFNSSRYNWLVRIKILRGSQKQCFSCISKNLFFLFEVTKACIVIVSSHPPTTCFHRAVEINRIKERKLLKLSNIALKIKNKNTCCIPLTLGGEGIPVLIYCIFKIVDSKAELMPSGK